LIFTATGDGTCPAYFLALIKVVGERTATALRKHIRSKVITKLPLYTTRRRIEGGEV
jgi:hypothetical protein